MRLSDVVYPIRKDLSEAVERAWDRLARPGTWWTGVERVAIAEEARHAAGCAYCVRCKEALSPFGEEGEHDSLGALPSAAVDVVHRLMSDQGRLTPTWFEGVLKAGLDETRYVELVGVVAHVVAVDKLHWGLGLKPPQLRAPGPGEPTRVAPAAARKRFSWVRTVPPKEAEGRLAEAWFPGGADRYIPRVHQAMSLVPDEVISFRDLAEALYLPAERLMDHSLGRAISRTQMELVAARTSALCECFY